MLGIPTQSHSGRGPVALLALTCFLLTASPFVLGSTNLKELLDLKPGEWRELPNTQMSAVFPTRDQTTWSIVGPSAVVIAWGGAAFDTKRNAFVFNGGGHADYGGNEVYAFFLEELKWRRLTDPSPMKKLESGQFVTTDNTPVSAHTYDGLEYLPNVDRIFRNGGAEYVMGYNFDKSVWLFDLDNRKWERKSQGGGDLPVTAYDPVRGSVYVVGRSNADEYDPVRDVWVSRLKGQADALPNVGALDPVNRKIVTDSYQAKGVIVYTIAPDGALSGRTFVETKGATEWDKAMATLEYDPVRRVLVAWAGGRETAYLDMKNMTWRRFANTESSAAPVKSRTQDYPSSGTIYGRWRYVPKYDVFIGYNAPFRNVWVWKPAPLANGSETPVPGPKSLLEKLKGGETAVLPPGVYRAAAVADK